jgi:Tol biopolymer transport system component
MVFLEAIPTPDGKKLLVDGFGPRSELVQYDQRSRQFVPFLSGISVDQLDFSRDGKWVVFVSDPDRTLWRSRIDGTERLQLTSPPVVASLPRWSPDGTQIVYTDKRPGQSWKNFIVLHKVGQPPRCTPKMITSSTPTDRPTASR